MDSKQNYPILAISEGAGRPTSQLKQPQSYRPPFTRGKDANQELSYLWKQVSPGSPSVSLDGEEEEVASFKAPQVDEDTRFKFELTVKDGKGGRCLASENEQEKEEEGQQPETTSEQVENEQEQQVDESP